MGVEFDEARWRREAAEHAVNCPKCRHAHRTGHLCHVGKQLLDTALFSLVKLKHGTEESWWSKADTHFLKIQPRLDGESAQR